MFYIGRSDVTNVVYDYNTGVGSFTLYGDTYNIDTNDPTDYASANPLCNSNGGAIAEIHGLEQYNR